MPCPEGQSNPEEDSIHMFPGVSPFPSHRPNPDGVKLLSVLVVMEGNAILQESSYVIFQTRHKLYMAKPYVRLSCLALT